MHFLGKKHEDQYDMSTNLTSTGLPAANQLGFQYSPVEEDQPFVDLNKEQV